MRLMSSTAIGLAVMLAGGVALAQAQDDQEQQQQQQAQAGECDVVWQDLDQEIAQDPELRADFDPALLRDMRVMRDAAARLEQYGHVDACNQVSQAIFEMMQEPGQYAEAGDEAALDQQATEDQQTAEDPEAAQDQQTAEQQTAEQQPTEQQETAVPIEELGQLRIDEIIGADVRDRQDNSIGSVDDVVIGAGAEDGYLIVGFGGFLGLGEDYTAVPLDTAMFSPEQDVVYLPVDEEQLEQAQTFERGDTAWMQDESWREQNRQLFAGN